MAQAALNLEGIAFCTLEIEGTDMPPSMNMIETIWILEGFGMGLPAMKMSLFDENETLSKDLNLKNGTKIKIRLGKDAQEAPEMAFRVFGWKRPRNSQGKVLHVVCIYDAPKFSAGSFSESFEGTSATVMQALAEMSGLQYDGPRTPPTDSQVWLNLNTTRISFSEDVAMRAYAGTQSAMARCVTTEGKLMYRDLMALLKEEPKFTLVHNSDGGGTSGTTVQVRAAKDGSNSGLFTHFFNYGYKLFGHSFSDEHTKLENLDINAQGAGVPVNAEIAGMLSERGARVGYAGYDYGTGPDEGFNVHENYERAYYQNLRLLSLFTETLVALSDSATGITSFTSVDFNQGPGAKGPGEQVPTDVTGRYIVGGKTRVIKNGTKYSEIFYLYRPFIGEAGNPGGTKAKNTVKASSSGVDTSSRNFT